MVMGFTLSGVYNTGNAVVLPPRRSDVRRGAAVLAPPPGELTRWVSGAEVPPWRKKEQSGLRIQIL